MKNQHKKSRISPNIVPYIIKNRVEDRRGMYNMHFPQKDNRVQTNDRCTTGSCICYFSYSCK